MVSHCSFLIYFVWPHHTACGISVPQPGSEPVPPALGAQNLNHCTAREVPSCSFDCIYLMTNNVECLFIYLSAICISFFKIFYLAVSGLSCGMWDLSLQCSGFSRVVVCGLSCPAACGILVPQPEIEPASPASEGGFLNTGPRGKSQFVYLPWRSVYLKSFAHFKTRLSFFFFNLFVFQIFLAVLGLCCCARAFSGCSERELLFIAVHGLLIAVASLVAEHRL